MRREEEEGERGQRDLCFVNEGGGNEMWCNEEKRGVCRGEGGSEEVGRTGPLEAMKRWREWGEDGRREPARSYTAGESECSLPSETVD